MRADHAGPGPHDDRGLDELLAERDYLLRSLDALDEEGRDGSLDPSDYDELRSGYVERAARVLRAVDEREAGEAAPSKPVSSVVRLRRFLGRRRARRVLVLVACLCGLTLGLVLAFQLAGIRLPGQFASGSVSVPPQIQITRELTQASELAFQGNLIQAIATYDEVLAKVPHQPEALAYRGWIERESGIAAHNRATFDAGIASIETAARAAPSYPDAQGFLVIVLLEDERAVARGEQAYRAFVADKPSAAFLTSIGSQMAAAFVHAGVTVPHGLSKEVAGA